MKYLILAISLCITLTAQVAAVDLGATSSISGNSQCFPNQGTASGSDYANYPFTGLCQYTLAPWSSAANDTKRNRLVFQGGGHSDYYGNELYALSLSGNMGTMTRITNPSVWNSDIFSGTPLTNTYKNVDGTPVARHCFGGCVYLPVQDAMFDLGTGYPNGNTPSFTWTFTMADNTWHAKDPTVTGACTIAGVSATGVSLGSAVSGWMVAYDSVKQTVWADNIVGGILYEYDPVTNCYAQRSNAFPTDQGTTAVIDPVRRKLFHIGNNAAGTGVQIGVVDISGTDATYAYTDITSSTTGCSGIGGSGNTFAWPGVVYDPVLSKIVIYPNFGNTLYIFDTATYVCSTVTFAAPNVPSLGASQEGTFGKFAYINGTYVIANWFNNHAFSFTLNADSIPGMGSSSLTCIDIDGDTYGVGPGCVGPDADDFDASVHTGAQAISKWGSLIAFLNHQGYNPPNLWYVSTSGTDTGSPSACKNTIGSPCATAAYVYSHGFASGDAVILRAGTWTNTVITPPSGSTGAPDLLLAYPGELPVIDDVATPKTAVIDLTSHSWVVVDGIKAQGGNAGSQGCIAGGGLTSHIVVRRTTTRVCEDAGIDFFDGLSDYTIELNVSYDMDNVNCGLSCQHVLYMGARTQPDSNVSIRKNIFYGSNNYPTLQWNGRVTNLVIEQNTIYSGPTTTGITIFNGMSNSRVQSNLIFNNGTQGVLLSNYDGDCYVGGSSGICPYDQTGNLFENNTIYAGDDPGNSGAANTQPPLMVVNLSTGCPTPAGGCTPAKVGNLGGNTYRNNIFAGNNQLQSVIFPMCTIGTYPTPCTLDTGETTLSTSIFQNNDFFVYNAIAPNDVIGTGPYSGGFTGHTFSALNAGLWSASSSSNLNSNPQFTAASASYWNSPASFNFHLASGSSSVSAGSTAGIPSFDLVGTAVPSSAPSLGALQGSVSSPGGSSSVSGSIKLSGSAVIH